MAQKAHQRFLELESGGSFDLNDNDPSVAERAATDFRRRVSPFLELNSRVGNIYTGSLFLSLINLLEACESSGSLVSLFSYGSGCTAELMSATIQKGARELMSRNSFHTVLAQRQRISLATYEEIIAVTESVDRELGSAVCEPGRWNPATRVCYLGTHDNQRRYQMPLPDATKSVEGGEEGILPAEQRHLAVN